MRHLFYILLFVFGFNLSLSAVDEPVRTQPVQEKQMSSEKEFKDKDLQYSEEAKWKQKESSDMRCPYMHNEDDDDDDESEDSSEENVNS